MPKGDGDWDLEQIRTTGLEIKAELENIEEEHRVGYLKGRLAALPKEVVDALEPFLLAKELAMANGPRIPSWFPKAGYSTGLLTLLFFMVLVVAGIFGHEVPPHTRMLVVFVVSLGLSLALSFIGGDAAAKGSIPLPFAKQRPIAFTASGGVAVFLVALLIGYYAYGKA